MGVVYQNKNISNINKHLIICLYICIPSIKKEVLLVNVVDVEVEVEIEVSVVVM